MAVSIRSIRITPKRVPDRGKTSNCEKHDANSAKPATFANTIGHQVRFNFASRGKAMNRFLTIATATLAFCGLAFSQTATGVIQGHVLDTTGSAIPGATV